MSKLFPNLGVAKRGVKKTKAKKKKPLGPKRKRRKKTEALPRWQQKY